MTSSFSLSPNSNDNSLKLSSDSELKYRTLNIELLIITKLIPHKIFSDECICSNHINKLSKNIKLFEEKELIPNVRIPILNKNNENKNISLNKNEKKDNFQFRIFDLCNCLEVLGFPINGSMINIYIEQNSNYVFYGNAPIDKNIILDSSLINLSLLKIKIINFFDDKQLNNKKIKEKKYENLNNESSTNFTNNSNNNYYNFNKFNDDISENSIKLGTKKTRERRINYVIEKVNAWRKLYTGFINEKNEFEKYGCKEAAKKIGVSKKSLDLYLLQLKLGKKYGFDFQEYQDCKIGVLRQFIQLKQVEEQRQNLNINDFIN